MNNLTQHLIDYVFKKIGIDVTTLDLSKSYSIFDDKFLFNEKIRLLDENDEEKSYKIYGVKYKFYDDKNEQIKFVVSKINQEYYLLIDIPEAFKYGLFYDLSEKEYKFLFFQNEKWDNCSMFLQFSMLAGLELCKDIFYVPYSLNEDDQSSKNILISLIEYCSEK